MIGLSTVSAMHCQASDMKTRNMYDGSNAAVLQREIRLNRGSTIAAADGDVSCVERWRLMWRVASVSYRTLRWNSRVGKNRLEWCNKR